MAVGGMGVAVAEGLLVAPTVGSTDRGVEVAPARVESSPLQANASATKHSARIKRTIQCEH